MKVRELVVASAFAVAAGSCAGATRDTTASTGASADEITSFQELAAQTETAASGYRDAAMGAAFDAASCPRMHDDYDARVRPWIAQMMQMAGDMDGFMDAHGGASAADFGCMASAMMAELERHRAVACTLADDASNRSEVVRHTGAMTAYGGHAYDRCDEVNGALDGGSESWAPMMEACAGPDDREHHDDGGMMHDGSMMH